MDGVLVIRGFAAPSVGIPSNGPWTLRSGRAVDRRNLSAEIAEDAEKKKRSLVSDSLRSRRSLRFNNANGLGRGLTSVERDRGEFGEQVSKRGLEVRGRRRNA